MVNIIHLNTLLVYDTLMITMLLDHYIYLFHHKLLDILINLIKKNNNVSHG